MYLAELQAENFRIYGPAATNDGDPDLSLSVRFTKGLSILVGENDSGKSAVVDAIRLCLQTTASDYYRISRDDFYCDKNERATWFRITCMFDELNADEQAKFLEMLTPRKDGEPVLHITLLARRIDPERANRISVVVRAGRKAGGPPIEGIARELLRCTYLRPLRDAENELRSARGSRLAQILHSYPQMAQQADDDFDPETDHASTLVGLVRRLEYHIGQNAAVSAARKDITRYLEKFAIGADQLASTIGVASDASLPRVLERLELRFELDQGMKEWTRRGLGYHNALFMAAELLLLGTTSTSPLLLIEEPEAHLHPQLQSRVMDLLLERSKADEARVQVIMTTHSPNIAASVPVEQLTLVHRGTTYALDKGSTELDSTDYAFLSRFLDVTKANLFFARSVIIVEGDAESLLLPAIAEATGPTFSKSGVSIVNVGHVGLFRYSRIFQRKDGRSVPVRVACLRDRDIVPDGTPDDMRRNLPCESEQTPDQLRERIARLTRGDGGAVKTFVSDWWTFEYDLAAASWKMATIMHQAISAAKASNQDWPDPDKLSHTDRRAAEQVAQWEADGRSLRDVALEIYRPLRMGDAKKPIAAQHAARLVALSKLVLDDLPRYVREAFNYVRETG